MIEDIPNYHPPPDMLQGRVILITGAADGIGRAVSKSFAKHGASTVLLDKKSRKLETLYDEILANGWQEPVLLVQDLKDLDQQRSEQISTGVYQEFHRLDGLLHNAAQLDELTPLHSHDLTSWQQTIQVNLTAPYLLTRALLPLLRASSAASIVFTSAAAGRRGRAYWGAYGAAYGGIEILAQVWADELEQNSAIRVNTIDPGPVRTRMRNLTYPGEIASSIRAADEIVNAYLYLMGDDSKHVRGQALRVPASAGSTERPDT